MRQLGEKGAFWRWGRAMYTHRWIVVLLWTLLFVGLGTNVHKLPALLKENGFAPSGSDADIGVSRLQEELGFAPSALTCVYTSDTLVLTEKANIAAIQSSLAEIKQLPYIRSVTINHTPRVNEKRDIQSVQIAMTLDGAEALEQYSDIRSRVRAPAGMKVYVDGGTATLYDIQQATRRDLQKSEMLGLPIALMVLLVIFGTLWAALLPLIVGVMSVTVTLGVTYFMAQRYELSNFMPNMVTMIGLAIGIDYALFVVSRFREELKRQPTVSDAVAMTCQMAGKSIFFSGFAVLIGMLGMLFIALPVMRALCLGGVLVVLTSVTLSNSLLLALLGLFGPNINRFAVFPALQKRRDNSTLWERLAYSIMKRPVWYVVLFSGMLILLMLPIGGMKLGVPGAEVLPPTYESRQGSDLLKQAYDAREANPIQVLVDTPGPVWEAPAIREIQAYTDELRRNPAVKRVRSYITALGEQPPAQTAALLGQEQARRRIEEQHLATGHTALLMVVPLSSPESADTDRLIRQIRRMDTGSLHTMVTGASAYRIDILDRINRGLPYMVVFVMAVTYVVLFAAFRSVLLPLKAVLMNVLSLGASLGIVVTVFQKGMMAHTLHITSTGYVSIVLPVTVFCVVFGISMDYEVFLISRIMEEYERTGDNDWSTAVGLKETGSLITSAALILMVVVGSFIFTDIEITKGLGVGLFSAVFIDATFIRVIVVPGLMKLLGRANWWTPVWSR